MKKTCYYTNNNLKICIVFIISNCCEIYHYANININSNIDNEKIKEIFEQMYDSFCDEKFYCREDDGTSYGEFLLKKVCEENNWKYTDFIEEWIDNRKESSFKEFSKIFRNRISKLCFYHRGLRIYNDC